jgi:hypothetical protein
MLALVESNVENIKRGEIIYRFYSSEGNRVFPMLFSENIHHLRKIMRGETIYFLFYPSLETH